MRKKSTARKNPTRKSASGGAAKAETPLSKLEALKRAHFTPEGKAERIAKARAALYEEESIRLSPQAWKWVAEDPDIEEEFW